MNSKQLDALLYEWVADMLNPVNGYPSQTQEYKISKNGLRSTSIAVSVPLYIQRSTPQVKALNNFIIELPFNLKNPLVGKYLYNMKILEIAECCECSRGTIHRNINKSRGILIDKMQQFDLKLSKVSQCG